MAKSYLFQKISAPSPLLSRSASDVSKDNDKAGNQKASTTTRFTTLLEIFQRFLSQSDLMVVESNNGELDDTIDYLTLKNLARMLRMDKRRVLEAILSQTRSEEQGMPGLVECIYRMQHHQSQRVYEKALYLSSKYLVGNLSPGMPDLTDLFSDLCQHEMHEPESEDVKVAASGMSQQAKKRGQRRSQDESVTVEEDSEEEEARNRAKTFLMSAAEKRAFEAKRRAEKVFNLRFKKVFAELVGVYMAC